MALHVALEGAEEAGARTRLIDLSEYQLVFCDGKEDESVYPKDVFTLREDVRAAQGIILVTPEYHGGYSGILKNALDFLGFDEFEGKMLGLVGVSGGRNELAAARRRGDAVLLPRGAGRGGAAARWRTPGGGGLGIEQIGVRQPIGSKWAARTIDAA
jgi:NAD(P)H-dependent FMN reductase